jgi:aspartate-semialdehyde dehydrogenase
VNPIRVGVLGASGLVGRELLRLLGPHRLGEGSLRLFGREGGSAGQVLVVAPRASEPGAPRREVRVEPVSSGAWSGLDLLFACAGARASRKFVPAALAAGVTVVDGSSAFRADARVPLCVPAINPEVLRPVPPGPGRLVATPNCSTVLNALVAAPIEREYGLQELTVTTYQAASGAGAEALEELHAGVRAAAEGAPLPASVFPRPLAMNVLARIGDEDAAGETPEEAKMRHETRRLLGRPDLPVTATCARVPTERSHLVVSFARLRRRARLRDIQATLARAPRVTLEDLPDPLGTAGRPGVFVGRLRFAADDPSLLCWVACGDQLLDGAAANALLVAEALFPAPGAGRGGR